MEAKISSLVLSLTSTEDNLDSKVRYVEDNDGDGHWARRPFLEKNRIAFMEDQHPTFKLIT